MAEGSGEGIRRASEWCKSTMISSRSGRTRGNSALPLRSRAGTVAESCEKRSIPPRTGTTKSLTIPAWNRLHLDKTLFEGEVDDHLEIEIRGEELDFLQNDQLERYHRVFEGDPSSWIGFYHPGDEGSTDPERMSNWWIYLEVESA